MLVSYIDPYIIYQHSFIIQEDNSVFAGPEFTFDRMGARLLVAQGETKIILYADHLPSLELFADWVQEHAAQLNRNIEIILREKGENVNE